MTEEPNNSNKPKVLMLGVRTSSGARFFCLLVILIGLVHAVPGIIDRVRRGAWMDLAISVSLDIAIVAALVIVLWGIGAIFDRIEELIEKKYGGISLFKNPVGAVLSKESPVASKELLLFFVHILESLTLVLVSVFSVTGAFLLFPQTKYYGELYLDYLFAPLIAILSAVIDYIPNLIFIFIVVWIVRELNRFLRILAESLSHNKISIGFIPHDAILQLYQLVRIALWFIVFVSIFNRLPGADSQEFKAIAAFVALVMSLSSSSAAGNFVAGIVLVFMRPFRVGDRIKVCEVEGKVVETTMIVTKLVTPKNEIVNIPNVKVLDGSVFNYSRIGNYRGIGLSIEVTIGYDVAPKTVIRLLTNAAAQTNQIETSPEPFVVQRNLGDFSITYELIAFTKDVQRMPLVRSDLMLQVINLFNAEGVEILSPVYQANRDGSAPTLFSAPQIVGSKA